MMAKRTVEYYRLWEDNTWDTDTIIVEDGPDLNQAVIEAAREIDWESGAPVIVGLYFYSDENE